jgi:hypothetical protein
MADVVKVLGQQYPSATTLTTLYTTPALTSAVVSSLVMCNKGTVADAVRAAVRVGGASIEDKQYLFYDQPLGAKESLTVTIGISIDAADVVSVYSTQGTTAFNLYGVEMPSTTPGSVVTGSFAMNGIISPATITASQNDYAPTGIGTCNVMRLQSDAAWNITGIADTTSGRAILLFNIGANNITLKDNVTSTATYRFALNGDYVMGPDESAPIWYDPTTQRWRIY